MRILNSNINDSGDAYQKALDANRHGDWAAVIEHVDRYLVVLGANPPSSDALLLKGFAALHLSRNADARSCFEQATRVAPGPASFRGLAVALTRQGEFALAAAQARSGLALSVKAGAALETSSLLSCLGDALRNSQKFDEAAQAYRHLLDIAPDHRAAHLNLGFILQCQDRLDDAIGHYRQAVNIDPGYLEAHSNLASALLATGRLEEAWPHFEHRWVSLVGPDGQRVPARPELPIRRWEGDGHRRDHHLLVVAEQGLGDTLQFCRYLPMVLDQFAEVTFVCPKPLQRLLAHSFLACWPNLRLADTVPTDPWLFDWHTPLLSLPKIFGTSLATIPACVPYLHADQRAARAFADRLDRLGSPSSPRIGIVWAGGHAGLGVAQWRSLTPEQIDPLLAWPHARWVSLQKPESDAKRLKAGQQARVIDWMDEMKDFADTAALVASLDLIISVDTSVAHLAGAMGKPVWLLNRFAGCWRWMRGRDDSPWYPAMRIFTQKDRGQWNEVLERVLAELEREWRGADTTARSR